MGGADGNEVDDDPAKAPVRALAYEAAQARLRAQREDREQIRNRSGTQLSVAVAAAAFLVAAAFTREHVQASDARFILGLAALVAVAVCHVVVFWPRQWWFWSDARKILSDYSETGVSLAQSHFYLAEFDAEHGDANEEHLAAMSTAVGISGLAIAAEVAFLAWFLVTLR